MEQVEDRSGEPGKLGQERTSVKTRCQVWGWEMEERTATWVWSL